jgi:GrpB-like predicted nucleotidyltransferase (UPF0157 family)
MKLYTFQEYHQKTEEIFNHLRLEVLKILPTSRIEHVGSSSIPGSISKGDLDVVVSVSKGHLDSSIQKILGIGYAEKKDTLRTDELCMLTTEKYDHDVAIQLIAEGSEFENFILFRDQLRMNPSLVEEYNHIKLFHQSSAPDDYREAKAKFIYRVLEAAGS